MKDTTKITTCLLCAALFLALASGATAQICTQPPSGLVSWWPGDGNANDIVDGNDGAPQNGATFASGLVGQAFSFDGIDDFVEVGDSLSLDFTDAITIEAWVNRALNGRIAIVAKRDLSINTGYGARVESNGIFVGTVFGRFGHFSTGTVPPNVWVHVAWTYDQNAGVSTLYINGVQDNQLLRTGAIVVNTVPLWIGRLDTGRSRGPEFSTGLVDELAIFNRALSAAEIQAIFNADTAGKCKVLSVAIDIKPGSDPNSINLGSAGNIPVAILSSPTFDAPAEVDADSLRLAGATVNLIGKADKFQCSSQDVNADGLLDLVCHFETQTLFLLEPGDTVAVIEGETFDGAAIRGEDSVKIVP